MFYVYCLVYLKYKNQYIYNLMVIVLFIYLYYMHVSVDFDPGSNSVVPQPFSGFFNITHL